MPYRDDQAALETRRDELRRDLAEATRHAAALADAEREKASLARELAAVEARLARARARRLPLLQSVRVASPCSASWEAMTGDDRVRFCASCQKNVYNLSAMESAEAERLLAEKEGSICVRLFQRKDGTVMTTDCPVGVRRRRVKRAVLAVAGAGALAATVLELIPRQGEMRMQMGGMEAPRTISTAPPTPWVTGSVPAPPPPPEVEMGKVAPRTLPQVQKPMGKPLTR